MKIGIVNAGNIGMNLATAWIRQGHDIMLSKDTHPEQLQERIRTFGANQGLSLAEMRKFKYGSLTDAAEFGDLVILSVYFPRMDKVLEELRQTNVTLAGKIVIDTMNPLNVDANFNHFHDLAYMDRTSTTEDIKRAFPQAIVFKALSTIAGTALDSRKWTESRIPPQIFVGGTPSTVATVRRLIQDTGFRPMFAGHDLRNARLMERLGILWHHLVDNEFEGNTNVAFDVIEK